ncbi:hypothetical protein P12x_003065 [Tundrisphaera lichenicola]|uniref:hypothetical protein n=1 Tax=Tundrisphaera lichenicola TaxID=2029860 RepID=UPI003EBC994C
MTLWIVGTETPDSWEIHGIYESMSKARDAAGSLSWRVPFIAPVEPGCGSCLYNGLAPGQWPGLFYPFGSPEPSGDSA